MKIAIIFIAVLILSYLCGAFYSLSFDISVWTSDTRANVLIFGVFISLAIS